MNFWLNWREVDIFWVHSLWCLALTSSPGDNTDSQSFLSLLCSFFFLNFICLISSTFPFLLRGTFQVQAIKVHEVSPCCSFCSCLQYSASANKVAAKWLHLPSTPAGQPQYACFMCPFCRSTAYHLKTLYFFINGKTWLFKNNLLSRE